MSNTQFEFRIETALANRLRNLVRFLSKLKPQTRKLEINVAAYFFDLFIYFITNQNGKIE